MASRVANKTILSKKVITTYKIKKAPSQGATYAPFSSLLLRGVMQHSE